MEKRKLGNLSQMIFAKDIVIDNKNCVLVQNGALEVLFNKDNALDIVWLKFKGVNVSFLSKNGLNDGTGEFANTFEGGFLYTCGMDNVSSCKKDKPIHGSLHYQRSKNVCAFVEDESVFVCGEVYQTALFGTNLVLERKYEITKDSLLINDTVVNKDFKDAQYSFLYHMNYGYPFLDEGLKIEMDIDSSEPVTPASKENQKDMLKITAPVDNGIEHIFYHTLNEGRVVMQNDKVGVGVEVLYDTKDFPYLVEWKSMVSGDYALGMEPSLTRFDKYSTYILKPNQSKNLKIKINFN